jgi:tRNA 2-thiocytidine biosynthesis protein TtcA
MEGLVPPNDRTRECRWEERPSLVGGCSLPTIKALPPCREEAGSQGSKCSLPHGRKHPPCDQDASSRGEEAASRRWVHVGASTRLRLRADRHAISASVTATPTRDSLERKLGRALGRAIADFSMIEEGDRILVGVSGGKDSYTLLHLLRELQRRAPVSFTLRAVNLDQGHPGYPADRLRGYLEREGYDFAMVTEDTYSIVTEKIPAGKTYCSLCSRLRRGILYRVAKEGGYNKIALGHHRDDVLQTLLLNLMFAGQLAAMPPKLVADEYDIVVVRPLVYCAEEDIRAFADAVGFPILPCDLCGSQDHLQRKAVGRLIDGLEAERPGTKTVMLAALQNVRPSHLLDRGLWKTLGLRAAADAPDSLAAEIPERRLVRG